MSNEGIQNIGDEKEKAVYVEEDQHDRVMRSKSDDLSVWEAVKQYKLVTAVAMGAAFCASLDGYQITLNGGIISNKGFIRQFANGVKVVPSKYVSAWGGIQSAGQTLGQIVSDIHRVVVTSGIADEHTASTIRYRCARTKSCTLHTLGDPDCCKFMFSKAYCGLVLT